MKGEGVNTQVTRGSEVLYVYRANSGNLLLDFLLHCSKTTQWAFTVTPRAYDWIVWRVWTIFELIRVSEMLVSFATLSLGAAAKESGVRWGLSVTVETLKYWAAQTPTSFASGGDTILYSELRWSSILKKCHAFFWKSLWISDGGEMFLT